MTVALIDKKYRTEKLLDWERKSLKEKFSIFSFSKKSTWLTLGIIVIILSILAFIIPFVPPRYGWGNWTPAKTGEEYQYRLTNFLITISIMIFAVFIYINIRNKVDLNIGMKRTANFRVTVVLNLGITKILFMDGWRPFTIKAGQPYFFSAVVGQIITIKRTYLYRLIDYYVRDEKTYFDGHDRRKASH